MAKPAKTFLGVGMVGLVIVVTAGALVWVLTNPDLGKPASASRTAVASTGRAGSGSGLRPEPRVPLFSENSLDDSGNAEAFRYSAPIADRHSLPQCYASPEGRSIRGIADLRSQLDQLDGDRPLPPDSS